jgi:hypothetical protein
MIHLQVADGVVLWNGAAGCRRFTCSWPHARAASGASDCVFVVSQVPEVARGAAQAWRRISSRTSVGTDKRPVFIVLHQVLW